MLFLLLLINKSPTFKNEYQLIKILEWKFGFFEHRPILDELVQRSYISRIYVNQLGMYDITSSGEVFLSENKMFVQDELIRKYPDQASLIQSLFA